LHGRPDPRDDVAGDTSAITGGNRTHADLTTPCLQEARLRHGPWIVSDSEEYLEAQAEFYSDSILGRRADFDSNSHTTLNPVSDRAQQRGFRLHGGRQTRHDHPPLGGWCRHFFGSD